MAHSNGKITGPEVTQDDIALTLGTGGRGAYFLCSNQHGLINMWAKYKPVVWAKWSLDRSTDWWKGAAGNCGIIPCSVSHYSYIPDKMDGDMNGWVYDAPKGGENSPCRMLDFDGYNHKAQCAISGFTTQGSIDPGSNAVGQAGQNIAGSDVISLSDIDSNGIANSYFGMMIMKGSSVLKRATASKTIADGVYEVSISTVGLANGEYTVYPFLCTSKQTDGAGDFAGTYFTVPNTMPATLKIEDAVSILVNARYTYTGNTKTGIQYATTVRNNRAGTITLTNNYLRVRLASNDFYDPIVAGELNRKISDMKVTGDTIEYIPEDTGLYVPASGIFTIPIQYQSQQWKVWVSLQTSKYITGIEPMEEVQP